MLPISCWPQLLELLEFWEAKTTERLRNQIHVHEVVGIHVHSALVLLVGRGTLRLKRFLSTGKTHEMQDESWLKTYLAGLGTSHHVSGFERRKDGIYAKNHSSGSTLKSERTEA